MYDGESVTDDQAVMRARAIATNGGATPVLFAAIGLRRLPA